ncbi:MAG: prepilin-type N-terminal cleavage/methylation domain-containing protein [Ignavibacteriae bacterium]|nr:prepilin-type N-terminal cleavage/methylation domain-containing protein [Ignavibacteriota bacterium]NOH00190.1 prepilin-type N-terminal cleavage/methylation domain-containing protein [Ignavibacteriota bacterium]
MFYKKIKNSDGFSLTELLVALVIIGVLVLLALPKLLPLVTKAKSTEAKLNLKQVHMLEKSYKFEFDKYSDQLAEIGFEQETLITEGGQARYKIEILFADLKSFRALATSVVDFDDDGVFNVWEVTEAGVVKEITGD